MSQLDQFEKKVHEETDIHTHTSIAYDEQRRGSISDAVFGEITKGGPDYRAVGQEPTTLTEDITEFA